MQRTVDARGLACMLSSNRQPTVVYNEASMRRTTGQRSWANTFPGLLCGRDRHGLGVHSYADDSQLYFHDDISVADDKVKQLLVCVKEIATG